VRHLLLLLPCLDTRLGLLYAARGWSGDPAVCDLLLQHGADPDACEGGCSAAGAALARGPGDGWALAERLFELGADPGAPTGSCASALELAALQGAEHVVRSVAAVRRHRTLAARVYCAKNVGDGARWAIQDAAGIPALALRLLYALRG